MKRIYLVKVFHDVAAAFSDEEKAQNYMNTYLYALEGSTSIVSLPLDDEELMVDNPDPNNAELKADLFGETEPKKAPTTQKKEEETDADEHPLISFLKLLSTLTDDEEEDK